MNGGSSAARNDPYYSKNRMGRVLCTLCYKVCRDDANFIVHREAQTHQRNLTRRQRGEEQAQKRRDEERAAQQQKLQPHISSTSHVQVFSAPFGQPTVRYQVERSTTSRRRIHLEATFSKASDETRPLHRWISAFEQSMVSTESGATFLLLACEGYETVAFSFPSSLRRSIEGDDAFVCAWDSITKTLVLSFEVFQEFG